MAPEVEYIAAGGNRQSQCADWSTATGLLAFGSAANVALSRPQVLQPRKYHLDPADLVVRRGNQQAFELYLVGMQMQSTQSGCSI